MREARYRVALADLQTLTGAVLMMRHDGRDDCIGVHASASRRARLASCGGKSSEEEAQRRSSPLTSRRCCMSQIQRTIRADGAALPASAGGDRPEDRRRRSSGSTCSAARACAPASCSSSSRTADLAGAAAESRAALRPGRGDTTRRPRRRRCRRSCRKPSSTRAPRRTRSTPQQAVFDNRQRLFTEGAIAQKDVNDAQVNLSQARNQYETARKHLEDLQGFAQRPGAEGGCGAARRGARAQRRRRRRSSATRGITSPIDGVVTDRPLYAGETRAERRSRRHGDGPVAGDRARPRLASGGGGAQGRRRRQPHRARTARPIPGKVTQISPALDAASTTVEVWVQAANQDGKLRPGSSHRVEMIAQDRAERAGHSAEARADEPVGRDLRRS